MEKTELMLEYERETRETLDMSILREDASGSWYGYIDVVDAKASAYDRLMSGKARMTPKEVANIFGFPIAMDCFSSNHEFQNGNDWDWFTSRPFLDGENDCWRIKHGMWARVPYGLLDGYTGDWKDSLTLPDGWEATK